MTFLVIVLQTTACTLSAFPCDRLSSVLVNSPPPIKYLLSLGCHPLDLDGGMVSLPSDATACTHTFEEANVLSERADTTDERQNEDDDAEYDDDDSEVEDDVEHIRVFRL